MFAPFVFVALAVLIKYASAAFVHLGILRGGSEYLPGHTAICRNGIWLCQPAGRALHIVNVVHSSGRKQAEDAVWREAGRHLSRSTNRKIARTPSCCSNGKLFKIAVKVGGI